MKVLNFVRPENGLIHDPLYNLGFEKYEKEARDCYLFMADYIRDLETNPKYRDKERVVLTLEEPNFCVDILGDQARTTFLADKILTLCPYTAECFSKRQLVFFPFSEDFIPKSFDKDIDIVYTGSQPQNVGWDKFMSVAGQHNFAYAHYNSGNFPNCTYQQKIDLYRRSKIALIHGLCSVNPINIERYLSFPCGRINKAFSHLDKLLLPQVKSRMFEAAFCKSLMLVYRDDWNPIENWFTPNKDFLYFSNEYELDQLINEQLDERQHDDMIDNAYNKAINNYTTKHFVERYLK